MGGTMQLGARPTIGKSWRPGWRAGSEGSTLGLCGDLLYLGVASLDSSHYFAQALTVEGW